MQQRAILYFCQKCRAANPLGQEFCQRCGTRLMLVVQPPSVRVGPTDTTPNEELLLERLTILESTLERLAERLEQGLKLLLRQSETAYTNHAFVKKDTKGQEKGERRRLKREARLGCALNVHDARL